MALNKPSVQSSTWSNKMKNIASHANDGDPTTRSVTDTGIPQWWMVDMHNVTTIDRIVIYFWPYAFSKKFYESVSINTRVNEGGQWSLCVDISSPANEVMTYMCYKKTNARYVKILNQNKVLYLAEVEVYGTPVTGRDCNKVSAFCLSRCLCYSNSFLF